jgi:hypothetical protein
MEGCSHLHDGNLYNSYSHNLHMLHLQNLQHYWNTVYNIQKTQSSSLYWTPSTSCLAMECCRLQPWWQSTQWRGGNASVVRSTTDAAAYGWPRYSVVRREASARWRCRWCAMPPEHEGSGGECQQVENSPDEDRPTDLAATCNSGADGSHTTQCRDGEVHNGDRG